MPGVSRDLERSLTAEVSEERLASAVAHLAQWARLAGSDAEMEAAQWVCGQLVAFGLDARILEHDAYVSLPGEATLTTIAPRQGDIPCITPAFAAPTPAGGVEGDVVDLGRQAPGGQDVRGKIVLLDGLPTPWVAQELSVLGALGLIHICPGTRRYEMIASPVWGSPSHLSRQALPRTHIASINTPDGEALRAVASAGRLRVRIRAAVDTRWRRTPIVLGEIRGGEDPARFLLLAGHLDSWHRGAMDNAAANACMLEISRLLAQHRRQLRRSVRVAFWSGHSQGRYSGSAWYADEAWEDLDRNCAMHLNIESPGGIDATVIDGKGHREAMTLAAAVAKEYTGQAIAGGRIGKIGDESFWPIGIPSIHLSSYQSADAGGLNPSATVVGKPKGKANGYGWWWHTPEDTPDKVDPRHLARDCRMYVALAVRVCTARVLPLDYVAAGEEFVAILEDLDRKA
ncbi:MAG: hypothetical protein A2W26_11645, partial [Acidobacteria bacterium RBG_16_64_8]